VIDFFPLLQASNYSIYEPTALVCLKQILLNIRQYIKAIMPSDVVKDPKNFNTQ